VDSEGTLTRWPNPIPASSPDPVKPTKTLTTIPVKRKPETSLFDEVLEDAAENVDADVNMDDAENLDWYLDDVGGGLEDEPEVDGLVREMGTVPDCLICTQSSRSPSAISERNESATRFPAGLKSDGKQTKVSW
jgi:hypothetical protein